MAFNSRAIRCLLPGVSDAGVFAHRALSDSWAVALKRNGLGSRPTQRHLGGTGVWRHGATTQPGRSHWPFCALRVTRREDGPGRTHGGASAPSQVLHAARFQPDVGTRASIKSRGQHIRSAVGRPTRRFESTSGPPWKSVGSRPGGQGICLSLRDFRSRRCGPKVGGPVHPLVSRKPNRAVEKSCRHT